MVGIRPRELKIKVEEFSKFNMLLYLNAYFIAQDKSDLEEVKILIEKIEENIEEANSYNLNGICYEICFCACIFGDKNKAIKYYNKCKKRLIQDKDINGLRVRAYYEFYINEDMYKAKELCNEGLSVKNKFPIIGQALMEESLINKLLEDIK